MQYLAQTSPSDAQCRFLLEVKQMAQYVLSSEVLTTHKVWGKVWLTISNFAQSLGTFVLKVLSATADVAETFSTLLKRQSERNCVNYQLHLFLSCSSYIYYNFHHLLLFILLLLTDILFWCCNVSCSCSFCLFFNSLNPVMTIGINLDVP